MKKCLKNDTYRNFVRDHILRPYQSMITAEVAPLEYSDRKYNLIPDLVEKNPEWTERVFTRMAEIYKTIETDVFPGDLPAMVIMTEAAKRGVIIEYT